jgi:hypothetical protein
MTLIEFLDNAKYSSTGTKYKNYQMCGYEYKNKIIQKAIALQNLAGYSVSFFDGTHELVSYSEMSEIKNQIKSIKQAKQTIVLFLKKMEKNQLLKISLLKGYPKVLAARSYLTEQLNNGVSLDRILKEGLLYIVGSLKDEDVI